jgi:hypothetical protein
VQVERALAIGEAGLDPSQPPKIATIHGNLNSLLQALEVATP